MCGNRVMVFDGVPGEKGYAKKPVSMQDGMNEFLKDEPAMGMNAQNGVGDDFSEVPTVSVDVADVDDFFARFEEQAISPAVVVFGDQFGGGVEGVCDGMDHWDSNLPSTLIRPVRDY